MRMSKDINAVENFLSLIADGEKQNLITRKAVLVCTARKALFHGSAL